MNKDDYFMNYAYLEALESYRNNEIPVGVVIVYNGKIIAKAHNCKESTNISINHAEILAITKACKFLGSWRLNDCTLYTTMTPCLMCIGAINESRISRIVCGFSSQSEQMYLLSNFEFTCGVQKEKCLLLMQKFFKKIRNN